MTKQTALLTNGEYRRNMESRLLELRGSGLMSDITLVCGIHTFNVHKIILVASSGYFFNMFTKKLKREIDQLILNDIGGEIMKIVLDFIYTGVLNIACLIRVKQTLLRKALAFLDMTDVCRHRLTLLMKSLAPDYFTELWSIANAYQMKDMGHKVAIFVAQHLEACLNNPNFVHMTLQQLIAILSSEQSRTSNEHTILLAIQLWVLHDVATRDRYVTSLLSVAKVSVTARSKAFLYYDKKLENFRLSCRRKTTNSSTHIIDDKTFGIIDSPTYKEEKSHLIANDMGHGGFSNHDRISDELILDSSANPSPTCELLTGSSSPRTDKTYNVVRHNDLVEADFCPSPSSSLCLLSSGNSLVGPSPQPSSFSFVFRELEKIDTGRFDRSPPSRLQISPSSQLRTSPSRQLQTSPSSQLRTSPSSQLRTSPSSQLRTSPSSQLRTSPSSQLRISPFSQLRISPSSQLRISPSSQLRFSTSSQLRISPSSQLRISPSSQLRISPSRQLRISPSSQLRISPARKLEGNQRDFSVNWPKIKSDITDEKSKVFSNMNETRGEPPDEVYELRLHNSPRNNDESPSASSLKTVLSQNIALQRERTNQLKFLISERSTRNDEKYAQKRPPLRGTQMDKEQRVSNAGTVESSPKEKVYTDEKLKIISLKSKLNLIINRIRDTLNSNTNTMESIGDGKLKSREVSRKQNSIQSSVEPDKITVPINSPKETPTAFNRSMTSVAAIENDVQVGIITNEIKLDGSVDSSMKQERVVFATELMHSFKPVQSTTTLCSDCGDPTNDPDSIRPSSTVSLPLPQSPTTMMSRTRSSPVHPTKLSAGANLDRERGDTAANLFNLAGTVNDITNPIPQFPNLYRVDNTQSAINAFSPRNRQIDNLDCSLKRPTATNTDCVISPAEIQIRLEKFKKMMSDRTTSYQVDIEKINLKGSRSFIISTDENVEPKPASDQRDVPIFVSETEKFPTCGSQNERIEPQQEWFRTLSTIPEEASISDLTCMSKTEMEQSGNCFLGSNENRIQRLNNMPVGDNLLRQRMNCLDEDVPIEDKAQEPDVQCRSESPFVENTDSGSFKEEVLSLSSRTNKNNEVVEVQLTPRQSEHSEDDQSLHEQDIAEVVSMSPVICKNRSLDVRNSDESITTCTAAISNISLTTVNDIAPVVLPSVPLEKEPEVVSPSSLEHKVQSEKDSSVTELNFGIESFRAVPVIGKPKLLFEYGGYQCFREETDADETVTHPKSSDTLNITLQNLIHDHYEPKTAPEITDSWKLWKSKLEEACKITSGEFSTPSPNSVASKPRYLRDKNEIELSVDSFDQFKKDELSSVISSSSCLISTGSTFDVLSSESTVEVKLKSKHRNNKYGQKDVFKQEYRYKESKERTKKNERNSPAVLISAMKTRGIISPSECKCKETKNSDRGPIVSLETDSNFDDTNRMDEFSSQSSARELERASRVTSFPTKLSITKLWSDFQTPKTPHKLTWKCFGKQRPLNKTPVENSDTDNEYHFRIIDTSKRDESDPLLVLLATGKAGEPTQQMYCLRGHRWLAPRQLLMPPLEYNCSVTYFNGNIYYIGGLADGSFKKMNSVFKYHVREHILSQVAGLQVARVGAGVCVLEDRIYVAGGIGRYHKPISQVEYYDSTQDRWHLVSALRIPRTNICLIAVGKILFAIGGIILGGTVQEVVSKVCESYDSTINQWTLLVDLPNYFDSYNPLVTCVDNRMYAVRMAKPDAVYKFNTMKNKWVAIKNTKLPVNKICALLPGERKFYAIELVGKTVHVFDMHAFQWEVETRFPKGITWQALAFIIHNQSGETT